MDTTEGERIPVAALPRLAAFKNAVQFNESKIMPGTRGEWHHVLGALFERTEKVDMVLVQGTLCVTDGAEGDYQVVMKALGTNDVRVILKGQFGRGGKYGNFSRIVPVDEISNGTPFRVSLQVRNEGQHVIALGADTFLDVAAIFNP